MWIEYRKGSNALIFQNVCNQTQIFLKRIPFFFFEDFFIYFIYNTLRGRGRFQFKISLIEELDNITELQNSQ